MTNSREKFEAWFSELYDCSECAGTDKDALFDAWKAGRESMRDEAAEICHLMWDKCSDIVKRVNHGIDNDGMYYAATNACSDCEDVIKEIQP